MKTYLGNGGIAPSILNLGTRCKWGSASRPGRFTPGDGTPVSFGWEDGWVPEPLWLDAVAKEKVRAPSGSRTPVVHPVA